MSVTMHGDASGVERVAAESRSRQAAEPEVGGIAADRLRSIVDRIENLESERKALAEDVKDVFTEAKHAGFDVKVLRRIIADRKKDREEIEELETLIDLYRRAL